jgi:hypothetical protein
MSAPAKKRSSGYEVRVPAAFYKDETIPLAAKALLGVIVAYADSKTRETRVSNASLRRALQCGRAVLERALNELCNARWLTRKWQRDATGRWARRTLIWQIPEKPRCSKSPQPCQPAAVKRAPCHIPSQVRSPKEKSSCTSTEEQTVAPISSNGPKEENRSEVLT